MLKLDLSNKPRWVDLGHGVRLLVQPITTAIMLAARSDPHLAEAIEGQADPAHEVTKAVARLCVSEWEGVGDADGNPIPVTPDGINVLLDLWPLFEAFQALCIAPMLLLEQEKNASPLLPNGTSAGAATTARPAKRSAKTARQKSTRR